jgi:hypothetical protein
VQVIGVGGKSRFEALANDVKGQNVIVIPDPQGEAEAVKLARYVGGRVLFTPDKIDDYLIACDLKGDAFYSLLKQARKV